jgi:hypothetical protein
MELCGLRVMASSTVFRAAAMSPESIATRAMLYAQAPPSGCSFVHIRAWVTGSVEHGDSCVVVGNPGVVLIIRRIDFDHSGHEPVPVESATLNERQVGANPADLRVVRRHTIHLVVEIEQALTIAA